MTTRYAQGLKMLEKVDGQAGLDVLESFAAFAPDLARYVVEFPFGDIYSRPGLSLRDRELATVSALAAMGTAAPQLRVHFHAALNVGISPEELMEICIHMAVYAGFPAALNAAGVLRDVLREQEQKA